MIKPQAPSERITRRNTVSVTPAIGARIVAGWITVFRILSSWGNTISRYILVRRKSQQQDEQRTKLDRRHLRNHSSCRRLAVSGRGTRRRGSSERTRHRHRSAKLRDQRLFRTAEEILYHLAQRLSARLFRA